MGSRETLFVLAFLAAWVVLNRWVLPWLGVPTCMSGGCAASTCPTGAGDRPAVHAERPGTGEEAFGVGGAEEQLTKGERQ